MRIDGIRHVSSQRLLKQRYDAALCASGFEERASYVAARLGESGPVPERRFVLGFGDRKEGSRLKNDQIFEGLGYKPSPSSGDDYDALARIVSPLLEVHRGRLSLLVDISSMTRTWYAGLLRAIRGAPPDSPRLDVTFAYVAGAFVEAPELPAPLTSIEFIPGFGDVEDPAPPSALILGLGYEEGRASAVLDYQDPDVAYAWIASPSTDARYLSAVKSNNAELLARLPQHFVVPYALQAPHTTALRLESLCVGLRQSHRVAIAPLGPKPFSLLALLVAFANPDIAVWRATTGVAGDVVDRKPVKSPFGLQVTFRPGPDPRGLVPASP